MKPLTQCVVLLALLSASRAAQYQIVEYADPGNVKQVAGVVVDPSGARIPGVLIEERSSDWETALRSTHTDEKGAFHFSRTLGKKVYHLQFRRDGFDLVRVTVRLDKHGKDALTVMLPVAT